jgi:hypothetical protein
MNTQNKNKHQLITPMTRRAYPFIPKLYNWIIHKFRLIDSQGIAWLWMWRVAHYYGAEYPCRSSINKYFSYRLAAAIIFDYFSQQCLAVSTHVSPAYFKPNLRSYWWKFSQYNSTAYVTLFTFFRFSRSTRFCVISVFCLQFRHSEVLDQEILVYISIRASISCLESPDNCM